MLIKINLLKAVSISATLFIKWTENCMDCFNKMKLSLLFITLFIASSIFGQRLRDSLFGGKLKADTNKTFVSKDTTKYIPPVVYNATVTTETKKGEVNKLDESIPDSLNKNFYAKQKTWKR